MGDSLLGKARSMQTTLLAPGSRDLRAEDAFGKFSMQCSSFKKDMRNEFRHFVLLPQGGFDKGLNIPELFRTLKLAEITAKNEKLNEQITEEDKSLEEMESCLVQHNELAKSAKETFLGKRRRPLQLTQPRAPVHENPQKVIHGAIGGIPLAAIDLVDSPEPEPSPVTTTAPQPTQIMSNKPPEMNS